MVLTRISEVFISREVFLDPSDVVDKVETSGRHFGYMGRLRKVASEPRSEGFYALRGCHERFAHFFHYQILVKLC